MCRTIIITLLAAIPGAVTLIVRSPPLPFMKHLINLLVVLILVTAVLTGGCSAPRSPPASPVLSTTATPAAPAQAPVTVPGVFSLHVDALDPGAVLPDEYTCKGAGVSPEISWENVPQGTKSLVLIVDDPDAPKGTFTHWLLYNIPPQTRRIDRAQPNAKVLANGAQQGDTGTGSRGYFPPCPPIGPSHRYVFSLYAVDYDIGMPTADREGIDWAMSGHLLGQATVTTTCTR
jgi:Raf kinase inhibitor-like YbhB/YbcL family protein